MRAIAARDAGLALASQIKRWLLAGALMLSGLFSLLAAHAFHGHLRGETARASSGASSSSASSAASTAQSSSDDGGGLQQPAATPAPATQAPAPVVSGGS